MNPMSCNLLLFIILELCKYLFDSESTMDWFNTSGLEVDGVSVKNELKLPLVLDKIRVLERFFINEKEERKMRRLIWDVLINDTSNQHILFDAIEQGEIKHIKSLLIVLSKYRFFNLLTAKNEYDQNCLHYCVKFRKAELIKFFIGAGLDINDCDHEGNTPLHLACQMGNLEGIRELILNQINNSLKIDSLNDDGMSALFLIVK